MDLISRSLLRFKRNYYFQEILRQLRCGVVDFLKTPELLEATVPSDRKRAIDVGVMLVSGRRAQIQCDDACQDNELNAHADFRNRGVFNLAIQFFAKIADL